jgi:hypothetical protein
VRALNAFLLLFGVLSTLILGAAPAAAIPHDAPPPACHEQATPPADLGDPAGQTGKPGKAMAAMACCISCIAAAMPAPPERSPILHAAPAATAGPDSVPAGLTLQPEHGPPKV